jgi:hypothetical protein
MPELAPVITATLFSKGFSVLVWIVVSVVLTASSAWQINNAQLLPDSGLILDYVINICAVNDLIRSRELSDKGGEKRLKGCENK